MLTSLAMPAFVGLIAVTFGWIPANETASDPIDAARSEGYEYLVQLSPADLEALRDGRASSLTSELPAEIGPIDRVRVFVGVRQPPRRLTAADATSPRRIAAKRAGEIHSVAKPATTDWGDSALIPGKRSASRPSKRTAYQNPPSGFAELPNGVQQAADRTAQTFEDVYDGLDRTAQSAVRDARGALQGAAAYGNRPQQNDLSRSSTTPGQYAPPTTVAPPEPMRQPPQSLSPSVPLRESTASPRSQAVQGNAQDRSLLRGGPEFPNERGSAIVTPFAEDDLGRAPGRERELTPVSGERNRRPGLPSQPSPSDAPWLDDNTARDYYETRGSEARNRQGAGGFSALPSNQGTPQRPAKPIDFFANNPPPRNRVENQSSSSTGWGEQDLRKDGEASDNTQPETVTASAGRGELAQLVLMVGSLGAAFFMWVSHMELRAKYRALLRGAPTGFQGRHAA